MSDSNGGDQAAASKSGLEIQPTAPHQVEGWDGHWFPLACRLSRDEAMEWAQGESAARSAPLVEREPAVREPVPATWCVVVCEQGCQQSWAVDVTDFEPRLTASDVERLLTPVLLDHEQEHEGVWR